MKVAIYIEDGVTQFVLTPTTDWEKKVVNGVARGSPKATILTGSFYDCRGGYFRYGSGGEESLMIRLEDE